MKAEGYTYLRTRAQTLHTAGNPNGVQNVAAKDDIKANPVVTAFIVGWQIGEYVDEQTGISDSLSDWLLDTFGPWPF